MKELAKKIFNQIHDANLNYSPEYPIFFNIERSLCFLRISTKNRYKYKYEF